MAYWAATRLEANRERVAQRFLELAGYEVYLPLVRLCNRRTRVSPLFPGYTFVRIEQLWRDIRLLPGVIKPVMSGDEPAHISDWIIAEIRSRERHGLVELPQRRLKAGDRVQIIQGLLRWPARTLRRRITQARQGPSAVAGGRTRGAGEPRRRRAGQPLDA